MKREISRLALAMAALAPTMVYAQSDTPPTEAQSQAEGDEQAGIEDIIVTATRRDTAVQTTPIAITAVTGETFAKAGVKDAEALMRVVPTVQISKNAGAPIFYIRGIGLLQTTVGGEPGVALHLNGVYLARSASANAAFYDLDRVEVLRGPQGTLYGRNATGGAVNFITARPTDEFEASGQLEVGNYDRVRADAMISTPLGGGFQGRVAGFYERRDGYTTNLVNGKPVGSPRTGAVRGTIDFEPENSIYSSSLVVDYLSTTRAPIAIKVKGLYGAIPGTYDPVPTGNYSSDPFEVYSEVDNFFGTVALYGFSWTNALDLGGVTVKSVTGYRYSKRRQNGDYDGTDLANIVYNNLDQRSNTFSQEVQLASNTDSPFQYLAGLFYFDEEATGISEFYIRAVLPAIPILSYPGGVEPFDLYISDRQKTQSFAAFGEASYAFTPDLKAIVGLRLSKDNKTNFGIQNTNFLNPPASFIFSSNKAEFLRDKWTAFTPKFVLQYENDGFFAYGSATRGFKAGGFNNVQLASYDPEEVWTYEAGVKKDWFGRTLRTNLSVFHSDYSNLQVTQYVNNTSVIQNAAAAKIRGVELEVTAEPVRGLRLQGSGTYLDAKYKASDPTFFLQDPVTKVNLDMTGRPLPYAPKYAFTTNLDYTVPVSSLGGDLNFNANYSWRSKAYLDATAIDTEAQPAFGLLDLRAGWESADGKYGVAVFGRNVTNEVYYQSFLRGSASVGGIVGITGDPRTYGVQLRVNY